MEMGARVCDTLIEETGYLSISPYLLPTDVW